MNFNEVGIIVDCYEIVLVCYLENVEANFLPWLIAVNMLFQGFLNVLWFHLLTDFASVGHLLNVTRHARPKHAVSCSTEHTFAAKVRAVERRRLSCVSSLVCHVRLVECHECQNKDRGKGKRNVSLLASLPSQIESRFEGCCLVLLLGVSLQVAHPGFQQKSLFS